MSVSSSPSLLKLIFIIVLGIIISGCDTKPKGPSNEKVVADYKAHRKSLNEENDTKIFTKNVSMKVMDMVTKTKNIEVVNKKVIAEDRIVYSILIETVPKQLVMALMVAETAPLIQQSLNQFRKLPEEIAALQIKKLDNQFKKQAVIYTGLELTYVETSKDFWKIESIEPSQIETQKLIEKKNIAAQKELDAKIKESEKRILGKWVGASTIVREPFLMMLEISNINGVLEGYVKLGNKLRDANFDKDNLSLSIFDSEEKLSLSHISISETGQVSFIIVQAPLVIEVTLAKEGLQMVGSINFISGRKNQSMPIIFSSIENASVPMEVAPVIPAKSNILDSVGGKWNGDLSLKFPDKTRRAKFNGVTKIELVFTESKKTLYFPYSDKKIAGELFADLFGITTPITHYKVQNNVLSFITILERKKSSGFTAFEFLLDLEDNKLTGKVNYLMMNKEFHLKMKADLKRIKTLDDLAKDDQKQKDKKSAWINSPNAKWFTSKNITEKLKGNSLARGLEIKTLDIISKGRLCTDIAWYKVRVKGKKRGRKFNEQLTLYFQKLPKFWTLLDPGYESIRKTIANIEIGKCQSAM